MWIGTTLGFRPFPQPRKAATPLLPHQLNFRRGTGPALLFIIINFIVATSPDDYAHDRCSFATQTRYLLVVHIVPGMPLMMQLLKRRAAGANPNARLLREAGRCVAAEQRSKHCASFEQFKRSFGYH